MKSASREGSDSLSDLVYQDLHGLLVARKLLPGDRLREIDFAERLNVSRTPVREAFKRMEAEGLIVATPPKGFVVVQMTPRQMSDLYTLREVLFGLAARSAADQASPMEVEGMRHLLKHFSRATTPGQAAEANKRLREALISAARNEYLSKAIHTLDGVVALLGPSTLTQIGRQQLAFEEHRATVEAIARRDADGAESFARIHARNAAATRFRMLSRSAQAVGRPLMANGSEISSE